MQRNDLAPDMTGGTDADQRDIGSLTGWQAIANEVRRSTPREARSLPDTRQGRVWRDVRLVGECGPQRCSRAGVRRGSTHLASGLCGLQPGGAAQRTHQG